MEEKNNLKLKPLFLPTPPLTDEQAANTEKEHRRQGFTKSLRRGIIEVALLFALISGGFAGYYYFTRLPFDSSQWKAARSYEKWHIRERMSNDLQKNNRLLGWHRSEIISLLGKPDQVKVREWNIGYMIGSSIIDPIMLVFKFDKQERVVEYDVKTFG
ncbi:MAG: hypothetical protein KY445_05180 [Armatimonadetes bacterium]|nr:hypothetical protein [Armatimonadota bacterium]